MSSRTNGDQKKLGAGRVVAVAIENNKTSQFAAKWAIDNILPKDQCLLLIHVKQRAHSAPAPTSAPWVKDANEDADKGQDIECKELFESFRVFCNRKSVQFQEVLLEDMDIPKALVESVTTYSIELLVLGAASRGLVKRFRTADVPSAVSKGAPPFCTVYIVTRGKVSHVRNATAPLTSKATAHVLRNSNNQSLPQVRVAPQNPTERVDPVSTRHFPPRPQQEKMAFRGSRLVQDDDDDILSPFTRSGKSYGSSLQDSDISFVSSSRPSAERLFPSLYDDMDAPRLSASSDYDPRSSFASSYSAAKSIEMDDYSFDSLSSRISIPESTDEVETEMRRLKLELKQTMEMYSTACKEALTAKQKAMELHRWKLEEQKKLEDARVAEEVALSLAEKEKEKYMAAMKAVEASQRIAELEAQKRISVEMKEGHNHQRKTQDSFGAGPARYRRYTIEEIEDATQSFSESLKIGEGGYGPVYKCELDHTQVAVKVLKADAAQGRAQFQQEVEVLSSIRHPNMVLLLGACPEYGCLVYEHMANGSLDDCLFRRGKAPALPWQLRFQIAAEIATGLLFLHQTKPEPLVHRDLKPGNILLDRNYVSKISDVGLARLVPPSVADAVTQYRMTSTAGTFCYIDPEYQQTGMLGIKSDIYSLGIMLLQIVTARPPMGLTHHVGRSIAKGTFAEVLDPAVRDWPMEQTLHFAKLALQCAEMRKKDRPNLGQVVLPELNKLRAFAEENMPMMMMFGGSAGLSASMHSKSSTVQDKGSESDCSS